MGSFAIGNGANGVDLYDASNVTVGGTSARGSNVISGNQGLGVDIAGGGANYVAGNRIGTDLTGNEAVGNSDTGVGIFNSPDNTIGGTAIGAGNVISGNGSNGILLDGSPATGNLVQGNLIGTDSTGTVSLGNSDSGVYLYDSSNNTIGGALSPGSQRHLG